jgi:hypothetical protein
VTGDPLTLGTALKSIGQGLAAFWKNGALLLWCAATVGLVVLLALFAGAYFRLGEAPAMLTAYGFDLGIGLLVLVVCASFKTYAERERSALSFVPDEQQSFWHAVVQPDGRTRTQISLRYQVTNFSQSNVMLSLARLYRPRVRHDRISSNILLTKHPNPTKDVHSSQYPVMPNSLTYGAVTFMIERSVGRKGKPMRVVIGLQDHAGRWHKVVFSRLKSG